MKILKYIILLSLFLCSTSIGFLLSKTYKNRVNELKDIVNRINILKNKIRFTKMPLADILEDISKLNSKLIISQFFLEVSKKLKKETISKSWEESIKEFKGRFSFKEEDIKIIENLGTILGKTDIDGQMSGIDEFNILIGENIKRAEIEKNKNEKMYKSLGTIIGLAMVIILY